MAIVGVPSNAIVNDFSEELKLLEGKIKFSYLLYNLIIKKNEIRYIHKPMA
jgi:hypothetical protein